MEPTLSQTNALYELSRARPSWTRRAPVIGPTKTQIAGRIAALAIVAAFVVYLAAVLVRLVW